MRRQAQERRGQETGRLSPRSTTWLAWSACAVNLSILALALLVIFLGWSTASPTEGTPWWEHAVGIVALIGAPVLGGLIASRRPESPYGWLWLGYGTGFALSSLADTYITFTRVAGSGPLPLSWPVYLLSPVGWAASVILVPFILLLFPDGRLPSPRWRFLAWAYVVTVAVILLLVPFRPDIARNPFGITGPVGETIVGVTSAGVFVVFAAIVASALSLVVRYRHAAGIQRQQLKWVAYAATLVGAWIVGDVLFSRGFARGVLGPLLLNIFGTVAVGIAILRHRLYDIDVIINRTLVYGALTATLALVYVGGVVGLQAALRSLTGQESTLAIVASTLAIAALFSPLRRRVQGFVDRRFYRRKYDAAKTLEAFNARLREETDLYALSEDLVRVARGTVQPQHVSL